MDVMTGIPLSGEATGRDSPANSRWLRALRAAVTVTVAAVVVGWVMAAPDGVGAPADTDGLERLVTPMIVRAVSAAALVAVGWVSAAAVHSALAGQFRARLWYGARGVDIGQPEHERLHATSESHERRQGELERSVELLHHLVADLASRLDDVERRTRRRPRFRGKR